ncbi:MAG: TPM domain-containing protein [Myxococcaceae bacterium]|nr:TPM domain-containing protein [Myxococcaceae bacterium]MCI0670225.1 TPM domain-containing protein [Myxococcaceae bacterium]
MTALVAALLLAVIPVPPLTGPVVDRAGVLSATEKARLEQLARDARAANQGRGPQVGFLTVPSLEGEPIEDFAIRVAEAWKLGGAEEDNGVLFVASMADRRMRIEVGNGVEGELPDAEASRIIREEMVPAFRVGAYGRGLESGARRALRALGVEVGGLGPQPAARPRSGGIPFGTLFFLLFFLLPLLLGGRRRRGLFVGVPGWGIPGSFGGGSGRGGGSWGGGGGGFSGGGSSGSW